MKTWKKYTLYFGLLCAASCVFSVLPAQKSEAVDTVLNVVFDENLPPYQYVEDDAPCGLHIDLLNRIAEENGLIINYVPKNTLTEGLNALENSEADIVLGAFAGNGNGGDLNWTNEISQSNICMIAPSDTAVRSSQDVAESHYTVSIQEGTTDLMYTRRLQNIEYRVMSNQRRVFEGLNSGKVDLAIGVKNSLLQQIKDVGAEERYTIINNFMGNIKYHMAVRGEDDELRNQLNRGIRDLRLSGEYEELYKKWIDEEDYETRRKVRRILFAVLFVFVLAGIGFVFNMRLNSLLKKQVFQKTEQLQIANASLQQQIEETRNGAELNRRIVENNPMGILVVDTDEIITMNNQSAQQFSGEDRPIRGMALFAIPLFSVLFEEVREAMFSGQTDIWNRLVPMKKSGKEKERYYRYSMYHLFHDDGRVRGMIIIFDDVTKNLELRDKMYESEKNRALNQIIAEIAHEIRNPLSAIKTLVELIPYKRDNEEFQDKLTQIVPEELDRINSLIKTLIDYARPQGGVKAVVDVNKLIGDCVSLVRPTIDGDRLLLEEEYSCGLYIEAVENQIKQVTINLLLNALEACEEKAKRRSAALPLRIRITSEQIGGNAVVRFYDQGIGMTEEELIKCTEIFYTTKKTGTGTGLAVCMQYVRENDGEMYLNSREGEYTQVTLIFPAAKGKENP